MTGCESNDDTTQAVSVMVADFFTFVWATVVNLVTLMTGIVALTIDGIRRWKSIEVTNRWYVYLIFACLFFGAFQAWREQHTKVKELQPYFTERRANITKIVEKLFVSEPVTQLQGDTITLTYDPVPESVRLVIGPLSYRVQRAPGIRLDGRKLILADIEGDVPFLTITKRDAPKGGIFVEYRKRLTEDPED